MSQKKLKQQRKLEKESSNKIINPIVINKETGKETRLMNLLISLRESIIKSYIGFITYEKSKGTKDIEILKLLQDKMNKEIVLDKEYLKREENVKIN